MDRRQAKLDSNPDKEELSDQYATVKQPAVVPSADNFPRKPIAADKLPIRMGRYELLRLLGEGAMGEVYLARDTQLDRPVAIKFPKLADDDREAAARFQREARAMATLRHPNICPVYDVGKLDDRDYLTMAYIEGSPLADYLQPDRPLPPRHTASLIRKLALALDAAHREGVVHRDLKPANILIDGDGQPVITDFGLARLEGSEVGLSQEGQILGTPAYMSPEQAAAKQDLIGPASDIYSLGAIMYQMLAGCLPCDRRLTSSWKKDAAEPPPVLEDVTDAQLATICRRAMAADIEDRFSSAGEFAELLREYLLSHVRKNTAVAADGDNVATPPVAYIPWALPHVSTTRRGMKRSHRRTTGRWPGWLVGMLPLAAAAGLLLVVLMALKNWNSAYSTDSAAASRTPTRGGAVGKDQSSDYQKPSQSNQRDSSDTNSLANPTAPTVDDKLSNPTTADDPDDSFTPASPVKRNPDDLDFDFLLPPPPRKSVNELFDEFDENKDDVITEEELPEHHRRMMRADANGDGKITRRELTDHEKNRPPPPRRKPRRR